MGSAHEVLEHMEHVGHAGGHDHDDKHTHRFGFSMLVGITMAILGVLLAFAGAKVGGERTELVKALVEQQHAHAKYQAQDIKHRTAMIALRQVHATIVPDAAAKFEADLKKMETEAASAANAPQAGSDAMAASRAARVLGQSLMRQMSPKPEDVLVLADTVDRYYGESQSAKEWLESFDPAIRAHADAQERYELAQLAAEFGIVIASISLLLKHRAPWLVAIVLGVVSIGILGVTYVGTSKIVHVAEAQIEETGKAYRDLRNSNKMTASDKGLVDEVRAIYGAKK